MTELQAVELTILKSVLEICSALNIQYFLVCGSALGAVKYGGFIPWDDDIDIGMFREDYRRFSEEAPKLLPEYYFWQTFRTDPNAPLIFGKVRDCRTTYIETSVAHIDMNHGVYVDVFPLDLYPEGKFARWKLEVKKSLYKRQIATVYSAKRSVLGGILNSVNRLLGYQNRTAKTLEKYEHAIADYPGKRSDIVCNHGNWQGRLDYSPRWHYGNGKWADFEGLKVRIPENYDAYFTQKYGDWQSDLPEDQKYGHHFCTICDLNKSYLEYVGMKDKSNGQILSRQKGGE